ncbi:sterol homeostasis protein [Emmonsiellopsis sp. PD_33]|nr:sterol homeostasis protein [Emmonsiellopsis sp. PD_33]
MPICIECCYPVSHLYTSYSKADDRALGKGVRLTQCPRCQRFADKYVEHDFVVLFIDLVLIKPQVYRHLLFNRLGRSDNKFDRSIVRLGTLILLFDVYLSWARIEKSSALSASSLSTAPIVVQYLFFLTLNSLATLAHHLTVRILATFLVPRTNYTHTHTQAATETQHGDISPSSPSTPIPPTTGTTTRNSAPQLSQSQQPLSSIPLNSPPRPPHPTSSNSGPPSHPNHLSTISLPHPPPLIRRSSTAPLRIEPIPPPPPASPSAISTALLVSSCTKLFPILLVIWSPESPDTAAGGNTSSATLTTTSSPSPLPATSASVLLTNTLSSAILNSASTAQPLLSPPSPSTPSSSTTTLATSLSSSILDPLLSLVLSITNTHLVLLNNTEALFILLDCGYIRAATLALGGQLARWVVEKMMLGAVGL